MTRNATAEQVAVVLKGLGDSGLLDTVLPIKWTGNTPDGTVTLGDLEYALQAPDKGLAQELADFINA